MEDLYTGFVEEVKALLLRLEDDLINLEENAGNPEIINNVFRVMHTLKGSAGMCGFKNIQDLTHEYESLYEKIREGSMHVNPEIIELTLQGKDLIAEMLKGENVPVDAIITSIREKIVTEKKQPDDTPKQDSVKSDMYLILFEPDKEIFERGLDPDKTLEDLKSQGALHIIPHSKKSTWEKQKADKICHTVWEIYLRSFQDQAEITDTFLFYDQEEFAVYPLVSMDLAAYPMAKTKLNKLYKNKIDIENHISSTIEKLPVVEAPVLVTELKTLQAEASAAVSSEQKRSDTDSTINVSSNKLDDLMNLVSELVTLTATLEAHVSVFRDQKVNNIVESIEKLTKKFRNNALDLRLVPVGTLLTKFKRQIRDLSKELGKKVNLLIEGQDIEIDKTILKAIESPLQHIIRNSIDHGLEPEEERVSKGKVQEGLLKITAFYSGASVIIQVQDDGRGINLDRVKECAIKKGLITTDMEPTKQDLINLILEPGFSTSENISMVSGRGVGMDVVRKELNAVGGGLEIFTEKELGTSITMKLPTTLTIIDTLMIEVADTSILIPITDIEYCFKEKTANLLNRDNQYIEFKNSPIPLIFLRKQFKFPASDAQETMVIVINKFDRKYAIVADSIVGEHQAVIKPLGTLFLNQPYFSGGSIMIDGKLALILDTNFLFNFATRQ